MPRNWQPPPGEPHARQPSSAASSSVTAPCANRAPSVCTLPASSAPIAGSITPPGTSTAGRPEQPASAIIIAGRPLSHVATPSTPAARRQRADQPAQDDRRVVAVRQAVEHARRALRAPVARVAAEAGERHEAALRQLARRGLHQQADLPVAGVVAERDRRAVGRADPAQRAQHQELLAPEPAGVQAHAGVLRPAEQVAARAAAQHLLGQREPARGPGPARAQVEDGGVGLVEEREQAWLRHVGALSHGAPGADNSARRAATIGASPVCRRRRNP